MKSKWLAARRDDAVDPITSETLTNYFSWLVRPFRYLLSLLLGAIGDIARFFIRPVQFRRQERPDRVGRSDSYLEDPKYKHERIGGGPF